MVRLNGLSNLESRRAVYCGARFTTFVDNNTTMTVAVSATDMVVMEDGLGRRGHKTRSLLSREYPHSIQCVDYGGGCVCVFVSLHIILFKCIVCHVTTRHL